MFNKFKLNHDTTYKYIKNEMKSLIARHSLQTKICELTKH